ncbi:transposase [Streptomyces sp. NPDC050263]|uniref:IS110 family transposase n=1 Tax=Streptomyces sp. NPDC050263 TaxID=3155037 RepID=UPI0034332C43
MAVPELWAGTDAGKAQHHCTVIDADGKRRLSRRVDNDETALLKLIAESDAKDAFVIADQARMRRDLESVHRGGDIAVGLRILTSCRLGLAADRTRAINRLRAQMLEYFPALERAFDYKTSKAALVLLTHYQTPAALRRIGKTRLATWLKNRKVRNYQLVAVTAVDAAEAQHTAVAGEKPAAAMVARLAREAMALDEEIAETDVLIEGRFRDHPHAEVILSMPGLGPVLGGDMSILASSDRLAGVAGLAPVPKDSGRISGNMRRPRRCCRRLLRVFYMSAMVAARSRPVSRAFYERQRAEGKGHKQAITALARRRLNVLWSLIRDGRVFGITAPQTPVTLG